MNKRLETKFIEYLHSKSTPLSEEIDTTEFMLSHFKKPDPKSSDTLNGNDEGVLFLKHLKNKKLINYDDAALSHVNHWYVDGGDNPKIKRWFDTLHEPLYVSLNIPFKNGVPIVNNNPTTIAKIIAGKTEKNSIKPKGLSLFLLQKEFALYFIYPLLVLMIGTIILKIIGII